MGGSAQHPVRQFGEPAFHEVRVLAHIPRPHGRRGVPLSFSRTYSSAAAGRSGPFGNGWTDNYNMSLSIGNPVTGDVTVTQENGSTLTFVSSGAGYVGPTSAQASS